MPTQNRYYSNDGHATYLTNAAGLNSIETDLQVGASTNWPTSVPFVVAVDPGTAKEELLLVTALGAGTALSPFVVTRGFDGTVAQPHNINAVVVPKICQLDLAEPQQHINLVTAPVSGLGAHGLPANAWSGGTMQLISKKTVPSNQTNVQFTTSDFATIPSSCNNIVVYANPRTSYTLTSPVENLMVQINGVVAGQYGDSYVQTQNTSTLNAKADVAVTQGVCGFCWTSNTVTAGIVARNIITFPFFNDAVWAKGYDFQASVVDCVTIADSYSATGGGGCAGVTSAITSLTFFPQNTPTSQFLANSEFMLYAY